MSGEASVLENAETEWTAIRTNSGISGSVRVAYGLSEPPFSCVFGQRTFF
jgi:hypothetical protein